MAWTLQQRVAHYALCTSEMCARICMLPIAHPKCAKFLKFINIKSQESYYSYQKYKDHKASAETGIGQEEIIERIISISERVRVTMGAAHARLRKQKSNKTSETIQVDGKTKVKVKELINQQAEAKDSQLVGDNQATNSSSMTISLTVEARKNLTQGNYPPTPTLNHMLANITLLEMIVALNEHDNSEVQIQIEKPPIIKKGAIVYGLYIDLQEFAYKNLKSNIKCPHDETLLQISDGGFISKFANATHMASSTIYPNAVMVYDKECQLALAIDWDSILFERNNEAKGENFDVTTTKRSKIDKAKPYRNDITCHDGREICLNWN
ncbi:16518_t:CDS:2 [Gigaspora margarita]|uniref:16518_t:CDS:1 n=1 Tax=Gigaspora margarita TaxID=4874 RepID=A0ABN7VRU0_GIGMA|nr:16518_t:CDS:2 [Gigaspora margarita]